MRHFNVLVFCFFCVCLTAQTRQLRYSEGYIQTRDSAQLFYRMVGEGNDTIVVVPGGFGFGCAYLMPDLKPLAAHHTLLMVDLAGSGYSTPINDTARLNMARMADDLETIRKFFKMKQLTLLGHSAGGLVCADYAIRHPEHVKALILLSPMPPAARWMAQYNTNRKYDSLSLALLHRNQVRHESGAADSVKACWDHYALWARGHFASPVEARRNWGDICQCNQRNLINSFRYYPLTSMGNWNMSDQLSKLNIPALIIAGAHDEMPKGSFEEWHNSLKNSKYLYLEHAAHLPHVDQPAIVFTAIELFLQQQWNESEIMSASGAGVVLFGDRKRGAWHDARASVIAVENNLMQQVKLARWDSVALNYATDATIMAPGAPPVNGRRAIISFWHALSEKGMQTVDLQLIDLELDGNTATVTGKYTMYDAQRKILDTGKFLAFYKKTGRKWQVQTEMFNTSMETRSPLEDPDYLK